jgi:hypothetical protein
LSGDDPVGELPTDGLSTVVTDSLHLLIFHDFHRSFYQLGHDLGDTAVFLVLKVLSSTDRTAFGF